MGLMQEFIGDRTPADLYDAYLTPMFTSWADFLVDQVEPQIRPMGRVLDVACGTGIVSRTLAARADVQAVEGIDIAPPMIEKAKECSADFSKIRHQVGDALSIPFKDDMFDAAVCQQGFQFFPDRAQALREVRRVLKPGAPIVISIWTAARDGNPVFGAFEDVIATECGDDLLPFGPFSLGDKSAIEKMASDADMTIKSLERATLSCTLPDARTLVLFDLLFLGRPGPDGALQPLFDPSDTTADDKIERMIEKLDVATASYRQSDGRLMAPTTAHVLALEA